jgi:hypothetical protein
MGRSEHDEQTEDVGPTTDHDETVTEPAEDAVDVAAGIAFRGGS